MTGLTYGILSAVAGRAVQPGEIVTFDVDRIMAHDGTAPVIARRLAEHGISTVSAADRTVFVFDHYYPPTTPREALLQNEARAFASTHGIPVHAGRGISHQLLPELGLITPGTVFVGADSHTCSAGAFGAFATGLGATDVAAVIVSGRVWLEVPEVVRVRLSGRLTHGADGHDLVLTVLGLLGTTRALGKSIEFVGPAIADLDMSDRFKLSNHAVEMGAVAGLIGVDERCRDWLSARRADLSVADRAFHDSIGADADLSLDLSEVRPSVALPSSPDRHALLADLKPVKVDQVFIGSCAGGRLQDLRDAAAVLAGQRVHAGVRLLVAPASAEVMSAAAQDGTLETLIGAGATLLPPGCGACMGRLGTLADGEVEASTQNRNVTGRAGSSTSLIYLASAATVAEAAIRGFIGRRS